MARLNLRSATREFSIVLGVFAQLGLGMVVTCLDCPSTPSRRRRAASPRPPMRKDAEIGGRRLSRGSPPESPRAIPLSDRQRCCSHPCSNMGCPCSTNARVGKASACVGRPRCVRHALGAAHPHSLLPYGRRKHSHRRAESSNSDAPCNGRSEFPAFHTSRRSPKAHRDPRYRCRPSPYGERQPATTFLLLGLSPPSAWTLRFRQKAAD